MHVCLPCQAQGLLAETMKCCMQTVLTLVQILVCYSSRCMLAFGRARHLAIVRDQVSS